MINYEHVWVKNRKSKQEIRNFPVKKKKRVKKNQMETSELKNNFKNSVDEIISRIEERISALEEKKVQIPNLTQRRKID